MHPPPPSSIHLHPVLCNTPNNIRTKISHVIEQFPQFLVEKFKVVHFDWKLAHNVCWWCWLWIQTPKIHFWANLTSKSQSCSFCLKIDTHGISRMLILIPTLSFWNFNPKIHFWANLDQKNQSCAFCLKIGTNGISRMLILIPTSVFLIPNSKFAFGQIWAKKIKVVRFGWKLTHMVSRGYWFLFQHLFSEFQTKNQFLVKFLGLAWILAHMVSRGWGFLFRN